MLRKKIVAGNWKMNKTHAEATALANDVVGSNYAHEVQLIMFPPAVYVSEISKIAASSNVAVGIQNSSQHESGAYTGELSAAMIKSIGVEYVLVGHSERRAYFNETNAVLAEKTNKLLKNNLTPIFCCGEVLEERHQQHATF